MDVQELLVIMDSFRADAVCDCDVKQTVEMNVCHYLGHFVLC